jgi:hypothetical protein
MSARAATGAASLDSWADDARAASSASQDSWRRKPGVIALAKDRQAHAAPATHQVRPPRAAVSPGHPTAPRRPPAGLRASRAGWKWRGWAARALRRHAVPHGTSSARDTRVRDRLRNKSKGKG